jgi:hypothetical protein
MKVGDLVQHCLSEKAGVVLEVRTYSSWAYWDNRQEERTEIRAFFSHNPKLSKNFSNAKFFKVIREAE